MLPVGETCLRATHKRAHKRACLCISWCNRNQLKMDGGKSSDCSEKPTAKLCVYTHTYIPPNSLGSSTKKVPEASAAGSWLLVTTHKLKFLPERGAEEKYCFCAGALAWGGGRREAGHFQWSLSY